MKQFLIKQQQVSLHGNVKISGAKNSALPILFASILANKPVTLHNVPKIDDIKVAVDILLSLGAKVDTQDNTINIDPSTIDTYCSPTTLVTRMRASFWIFAPLLAKYGRAKINLPGGCPIGARGVDMHIAALKQLGAYIPQNHNKPSNREFTATVNKYGLRGTIINLHKVSVGATITTCLAAVLAKGKTVINNAAREPEIVDLANFLNKMGAKVFNAGTKTITIVGVKELQGCEHSIIPDRIETGSFLVAAAATKGIVTCTNTQADFLTVVLKQLENAGGHITLANNGTSITLDMQNQQAKAIDVNVQPYPGMPTDLQAQFTVLNSVAQGNSNISETIFEKRFQHVPELVKMGAKIQVQGNMANCEGVNELTGSEVTAADLRAGYALIIAAAMATGDTTISGVQHITRGYENIQEKFKNIGLNIEAIN